MADTSSLQVETAYAGLPATQDLPSAILEGYLSGTSIAAECFVYQRFSQKLQAYMVSYVSQVSGLYPIPYI